jgi:hypothetical protein
MIYFFYSFIILFIKNMNESIVESLSNLDAEFVAFNQVSYDDWYGIVDKGIVLYLKLAETNDVRKIVVASRLRELQKLIGTPDAERPNPSDELVVRISKALKDEPKYRIERWRGNYRTVIGQDADNLGKTLGVFTPDNTFHELEDGEQFILKPIDNPKPYIRLSLSDVPFEEWTSKKTS